MVSQLGESAAAYRNALEQAGRVVLVRDRTLRLSEMFARVSEIGRARERDGNHCPVIDAFMSDGTWHRFEKILWEWDQSRYGISRSQSIERRTIEPSMEYFKFEAPEIGRAIAAFTDWDMPAQLPNGTLLFCALSDINIAGEFDYPDWHLIFENVRDFAF